MSNVNLALPAVQIREIRINSITGYQGNAEELVQESGCGLKDKNRSFSQCLGCAASKAACMTVLIQDGAAHGHALLDVLGEPGMEARGAAIFHHDAVYNSGRPENDQLAQRVRDYGNVPNFNVCNKQDNHDPGDS